MDKHTCTRCGQDHSVSRLSRFKTFVGNVVAVLAVPAAVIAIWNFRPVEEHVCRSPMGALVKDICEDGDIAVSTARAEAFLSRYRAVSHANPGVQVSADAGPRTAWQLLTSDYRSELDYGAFASELDGVEWEEPVGAARRLASFNTFGVRFRVFYAVAAGGTYNHVITYEAVVTLTMNGDQVQMASQRITSRVGPTLVTTFPRWTLVATDPSTDEETFADPDRNSAVTLYPRDTVSAHGDDHVGGTLTVLCRIDVNRHDEPWMPATDDGTWFRVLQGWMRPSALQAPTGAGTTSVPMCDPRAATLSD